MAAQYDLNDDDIINDRNYHMGPSDYNSRGHLNAGPATTHIRHTMDDSELMRDRDDRYPLTSQSHLSSSRRDRPDEYSPHRGGRNSRRVLNAM